MSRRVAFRLHRLSMRSFLAACRRLSIVLFAVLFAVVQRPSRAQTALVQPLSVPKTVVFLADPQLGVAGAYQSGGNTLYFEARTPVDSEQVSARLLDAAGRTSFSPSGKSTRQPPWAVPRSALRLYHPAGSR
jgi:hypothetical protein